MSVVSLPHVLLAYGGLVVITIVIALWEMGARQRAPRVRFGVVLAWLGAAVFLTAWQWYRAAPLEWGIFTIDRFSLFLALLTLGTLGLVLCQLQGSGEHTSRPLYSLPLLSTLGLLAVIHSQDLWGIYLGLELTLLPLLIWFGEGIAVPRPLMQPAEPQRA